MPMKRLALLTYCAEEEMLNFYLELELLTLLSKSNYVQKITK